jgi:apolipoprotein N-acyltransferase
MTEKKWLLLLPCGGILTALCLVLPAVGFLQWVTMTPALVWLFAAVARAQKPRYRAFYGAGVLYFLPFYLTIYHWFFYLYPMEFAGVTKSAALALVVTCWLGLSLLQTTFSALVFPLFSYLSGTRLLRRVPLLLPVLFAVQYAVSEWGQTFTWMGVPWSRLVLGQIRMGFFANSASLFGSYFLTFLLVLCNAYLAYLILYREKWRLCAVSAAAVVAFAAVTGAVGYAMARPDKGEALAVAAVQGNIGSSQKWSESSTQKTMEVYEKYTAEAAAAGADIVVFPETFLPYVLTEGNLVGRFVRDLAIRYDVTVLCGALHYGEDGRYNAMFAVYPDGSVDEEIYFKRNLVPFGEYVPWRPFIEAVLPILSDINMLSHDFTAGTDSALIDTPYGRIGGLICFDSIYERLTLDSVRDGAELLVIPTNDSWFTDSAAVYMHSAQARLRAIESGKWIVRAADTGISSVIDPRGSSHEELPPLVEGMSLTTAYVNDTRTVYSYIGNTLIYLMIAALVVLPASELAILLKKKREE